MKMFITLVITPEFVNFLAFHETHRQKLTVQNLGPIWYLEEYIEGLLCSWPSGRPSATVR